MFITFEGPEGGGKTTQMPRVETFLHELGYTVLTTREPGGTPIGEEIRKVLLEMKNKAMHPRSEILLFQASRAQLVETVIRPALAEGQVVLCDRYADSTLAYQGYGHGLDLASLRQIVDFATGGLQPDLTIFLDIDVEAGLNRRKKEGNLNRLDALSVAFHQRVRTGYKELAAADPERWLWVDAAQDEETVTSILQGAVQARLAARAQTTT